MCLGACTKVKKLKRVRFAFVDSVRKSDRAKILIRESVHLLLFRMNLTRWFISEPSLSCFYMAQYTARQLQTTCVPISLENLCFGD